MAASSSSFTLPSPKTSAFLTPSSSSSNSNPTQKPSIAFRPDRRSNPSPLLRVNKVQAAVNEVVLDKSSNNNHAPVSKAKSEKSPANESAVAADAESISAFMNQVADLVRLVDSRDIMELELKQLDCEVVIRKKEALQQQSVAGAPIMMMQPQQHFQPQPQFNPAPVSAPPPSAMLPPTSAQKAEPSKPKSSHPPLKCPMAGTFYRAPAPGAAPFVKVGDKVQKGQIVCIIEAMKLMNEIEADQSGTLVEILAEEGKPVSVDMPLFIIEP